jgi:hypothetical protein
MAVPRDLVVEDVDYRDVGVDLDGSAVEIGGVVAPPVDGIESGIVEERIAGEDFYRFYGAVGRDERMKFDASFMMESDGNARIDRLDALD